MTDWVKSASYNAVIFAITLCCVPRLVGQSELKLHDSFPNQTSVYIPHLSFDVISIHENKQGGFSYIDNAPKSSEYRAAGISPWALMIKAYDLKLGNLLTNVPEWAMTTKYDLSAKSDIETDELLATLSVGDFNAEKHHMLRLLLADRFHLQIHSEKKEVTTYELAGTKRATTLMIPVRGEVGATVSTCTPVHYSKKGREIESKGCPFSIFFNQLQQDMGMELIDHTGMEGMYAYHLMWNPNPPDKLSDDENRYPDLEVAVREQLGLALNKTKGPVTIWVVDRIEKPTAN